MASISRENIGLLNDKITVTISKEDYYTTFEKAIKDYSKKANIPGFRKGMVPAGMVKKMYGASIYYDEVIKAVEKEIQQFMTVESPEIFGQPLPMDTDLRKLDMNNPAEYHFSFEIGLKPEVRLDALGKDSFTINKVAVSNEMIQAEIERLKTRHGKMTEPDTVTSEDNALNFKFTEADHDGNIVENGIAKDNSLLVKYFTPDIREKLIGKKKDDVILIQLKTAFESKEAEWILSDLGVDNSEEGLQKHFQLTITKVGLIENRELNEDFFNEVLPGKEIRTEDAFREQIKNQLQQNWDAQSKVQLHDQIYHKLLDTPLEFPETFLKHWLERGGEKVKSPEEVEAEFPTFKNQLKWTLITDKIIRDNKLEVSDEELRENMKNEVMQYFGQMNMAGDMSWLDTYVDRMMKEDKQVDSSYNRLITNKLFVWAESQISPLQKDVTPEELTAMQHHH